MSTVTADTVGDLETLIPSFQRHLRATNKSPKTVRVYLEASNQLLAFLKESGMPTAVRDISREHVEAFIERLVETRAPATAHNRYRSLNSLFAFLVEWGEISVSPMARMKPPRIPETTVPILTDDELKRLVGACGGTGAADRRDMAVIQLFIDSGMRMAELANLKVEDVDLDVGVAFVMGKGRRPRACPFGKKTAAALDRYLRQVRARSTYANTSDAMWLGTRGPVGVSGIRSLIERRAEMAGVGHVHAHQFRHSFANNWLAGGGSETDLMKICGWKSREMVGRYAASAAVERALNAYQAKPSPADRL